jgi:hypothetical protein
MTKRDSETMRAVGTTQRENNENRGGQYERCWARQRRFLAEFGGSDA